MMRPARNCSIRSKSLPTTALALRLQQCSLSTARPTPSSPAPVTRPSVRYAQSDSIKTTHSPSPSALPEPEMIPSKGQGEVSPHNQKYFKAGLFKKAFYDDPADEEPDERFILSRLRTVLHPPSTLKRPAQPDPFQVLDATTPFLRNKKFKGLLSPYVTDIAKSISGHFAHTPPSKVELPSLQKTAGEVLSVCFITSALEQINRSSRADTESKQKNVDTVAEEYALYILHQTLPAAAANDRRRLDTLYQLLENSFRLYQSLCSVYRIPVPLVAASVVLRTKLDIQEKAMYTFVWPSSQVVGTYLDKFMAQRGYTATEYTNNITQLYDLSPYPDLPPTPEALQVYLSKLITKGDERGVMDAWSRFRDYLDTPSPQTPPPGSLFDHAARPRVLFIYLYALKAPRFGDSFPQLVDGLEACSQEVLSLIPRPYSREVLHCLMANRARVSGPGPRVESGSEVYSLDPDAEVQVTVAKVPSTRGAAEEPMETPMTIKEISLRNMHDIWSMAWEKGAERDVKLYMIYLEGLGRLGDLDTLQNIWNQLIEDDLCAAIYRKEVCGGDQNATFPPTEALNQMIASTILIPRFGPDRAMELFNQACQPNSSIPCNITTINTVLRYYARRADIPGMQQLFGLAESLHLKPDLITYATLVQGLLRAGRLDMAKATMESMHAEGMQLNERMCTLLIADLAKDGRRVGMQHAEELMREMKVWGFEVGVHAWTALISGYFRGGWVDDGWDAVKRMEETGTRLNRVSFNVILRQAGFKIEQDAAAAERGVQPITLRLFHKMVQDGERPNADTYTIVLIPLVKARLWTQAEEVIEVMSLLRFSPEKSTLRELLRKVKYRRPLDYETPGKRRRR